MTDEQVLLFEQFKYAHKHLCDNCDCKDCPLDIQVMHDATLKSICDIIEECKID